jgi:hypothetical protein
MWRFKRGGDAFLDKFANHINNGDRSPNHHVDDHNDDHNDGSTGHYYGTRPQRRRSNP